MISGSNRNAEDRLNDEGVRTSKQALNFDYFISCWNYKGYEMGIFGGIYGFYSGAFCVIGGALGAIGSLGNFVTGVGAGLQISSKLQDAANFTVKTLRKVLSGIGKIVDAAPQRCVRNHSKYYLTRSRLVPAIRAFFASQHC